ncbi:ferric reductase family protein [Aspergillus stella-maris]|uniref:ferric reductase family protein n=1 Tax=Aspergillus stella-maris TaxID=1810926 RepID=UPI003CCE05E9
MNPIAVYAVAAGGNFLLRPWTKASVFLHLSYAAISIFLVFFKTTSLTGAGRRAGELALINLIFPLSTIHLSFLVDLLGIRWSTYCRIHRATGWMAVALLSFHVIVAVQAQGFTIPLHELENLFTMLDTHPKMGFFLEDLSLGCVGDIWTDLSLQLITLLHRNGLFAGRGTPRAIMSLGTGRFAEGTTVAAAHIGVVLLQPVKVEAGQYINLRMPSVSLWSWMQTHPFTITSWSRGEQDVVELLVQPRRGLNANLVQHASAAVGSSVSFQALFTGPHWVSREVDRYENILVLASRSGIAKAAPYLKKIIYESVDEMIPALTLLNDLLKDDIMDDGYILHISIYVRYGLEQNELPFGQHKQVCIYPEAPNFQSIVSLEASSDQFERHPEIWDEQVSATNKLRDHIQETV